MFLNPEQAMSQHSEHVSKIAESSHSQTTEYHSEADEPIALTIEEDNESVHETTDSDVGFKTRFKE